MTAFATPTDLVTRYDFRVLGQLISDSGIAEGSSAVIADPITAQLLADASGLIVSYALKGGRYTESDLSAMAGNGAALLKRMTCDLALYYAVLRRGLPVENYPQVADAAALLEKLSQGLAVFPLAANMQAGVAESPPILVQTIVDQNLLVNSVRYFPTPRFTLPQLR